MICRAYFDQISNGRLSTPNLWDDVLCPGQKERSCHPMFGISGNELMSYLYGLCNNSRLSHELSLPSRLRNKGDGGEDVKLGFSNCNIGDGEGVRLSVESTVS